MRCRAQAHCSSIASTEGAATSSGCRSRRWTNCSVDSACRWRRSPDDQTERMPHLSRPVRITLKLILLAVVGVVFVRPVANNFVKAVRDIHDVNVSLLIVAIALQGCALFA